MWSDIFIEPSEIMVLIPLTDVRLHPCDPSAAHVPPDLPAFEFKAVRHGQRQVACAPSAGRGGGHSASCAATVPLVSN